MYTQLTTEQKIKAMEYLNELLDYGFGEWNDTDEYERWKDNWEYDLERHGFSICDGATKVVAIIDDFPWVIKTDLPEHNYCYKEVENWQLAIKEGWTNYLAATYTLTIVEDKIYYIQEYAEGDADYYDSKCYDYYRDSGEITDENEWFEPNDEEMVVALIGGPQIDMFIQFCWNLDINDLHCGNFGQTLDGRTVIFDYSGF